MVHTALEDTAAGGSCDMQGHVAASAGRTGTPHPEEGRGEGWSVCVCVCVCVTYDLRHNRLDI